ncbi:DNA adenine methylase [Lentzea fradiae]|uniref:site-specific DNA-methyltransferase (adenine-specific) n=1 Tax=Lentzea fradiae TaxID=200378 RepID=A0A1G8DLC4_9PSEU|nr:DNA adenine methylase [Lentzea fradiae]SDH58452.1 DNA adenine methylase [Lentzea fradiae]
MRYLSPLRYPGGKARLAPYIARLIAAQEPRPQAYAEPFAGGAGAALRLLVDEEVQRIYINDLNPGIAAFWRCVFSHTEDFARKIETEEISIEAWHRASATYASTEPKSDLDLGFATFFLNRCNRSGILNAGPIGGHDQTGRWKIDARFNRESLAHRVRYLGQYRKRVRISELDGRAFLRKISRLGDKILVYVDPPYLVQGEELYLDSLNAKDHAELATLLAKSKLRWFLTYDAHERITEDLYSGLRTVEFDIAHTAHVQHIGKEYAVFGKHLTVPDVDRVLSGNSGRWVSAD